MSLQGLWVYFLRFPGKMQTGHCWDQAGTLQVQGGKCSQSADAQSWNCLGKMQGFILHFFPQNGPQRIF